MLKSWMAKVSTCDSSIQPKSKYRKKHGKYKGLQIWRPFNSIYTNIQNSIYSPKLRRLDYFPKPQPDKLI